jgi:hypothetical protein
LRGRSSRPRPVAGRRRRARGDESRVGVGGRVGTVVGRQRAEKAANTPLGPSPIADRVCETYPGRMEISDAELAWIVDRLVTLEQQIRAPKGQTGFPKSTIASTLKGTSPPERIRKILDAVK